ncbi:ADP-ribosylglycohydrolase family protein [Paratractidigestivibacter sp.]|uniref:ADP-ribosylglycohydrolase family protein n=1 Tax=Paratractidigestivibacter sp. TaxID=2847316 RepID=UPI002AC938B8|nr:ADP-ribosylglycohydrolase family protein [Paratractidigestivibacter sp.]
MATLRDCVYGQAVGDALGVPFEFRARDSFCCSDMVGHGTHDQPAGTWSDDTSMALAICDSYRQLGRIDTQDIRRRFCDWYGHDAYTCDHLFDIGNATATALRLGHGLSGERDNGNGSLMRTIPLAFAGTTDDEVVAVSAITHAHPTSTEVCVRMVRAARELIAGAAPRKVAAAYGVDVKKSREAVRSGGFVRDTFDAALWCLANTDNYADCVLLAVNLGDDTDTTGAVAGALAGIVYGEAGIPQAWRDRLRGTGIIDACLF